MSLICKIFGHDYFEFGSYEAKVCRRCEYGELFVPNGKKLEGNFLDVIRDASKSMHERKFEQETGKHAIWGGKETKAFKEWKRGE